MALLHWWRVAVGGAGGTYLRGGESTERAVWPVGVVLDPPGLGNDVGFEERPELFDVEEFVAGALKLSMYAFSHGEPGSM